MKIILALCALLVVAAGVEWFLCRRYVQKAPRGVRTAVKAVLVGVWAAMGVAALGMVWLAAEPWFMSTAVWVVWAFMLVLLPSVVLALFTLIPSVWSRRAGALLALALAGVMIHGATWGRTELRVEYITIESDRLPAAFDGLRVAQFSDVHLGNWGADNGFIERLVERINAEAPDLVVQSGDLVNITPEELNDRYRQSLGRIAPPVYAVLGNHDLGFYVRDTTERRPSQMVGQLIEAQQGMGWQVLQNEGAWLRRGGDSILIAGVTHPNNHRHNGSHSGAGGSDLKRATAKASDSTFVLLVAHSPALADSIPAVAKADVVLSGHVHAMQAKFELWGHSWSPAEMLYPMHSGLYDLKNGTQLYINDGIGFVLYPMRIGAKPELTVFTFKKRA